jgi:hypothetical protein
MSKRRVPTKVLEMSGAIDKNPGRYADRANEPQPTGPLGDPPAEFLGPYSTKLLAAWNEIIARAPEGVLTSADHAHVEMTARVMVRTRSSYAKSSDFTLLDKLLGKMGCNPADRSKVAVTKPKPEDEESEWAQLAQRSRTARA